MINNSLNISDAVVAKEELEAEINKLLCNFVEATGLIPIGEITAKTNGDYVAGKETLTDYLFIVKLKVWI